MRAPRLACLRGSTVMELVVAVAMFGMAVAGTAGIIYQANGASTVANAHQIASLAAQSEIEALRAAPFSSLEEHSDEPVTVAEDYLQQVPTLSLFLTVTELPETEGRLKEVHVKASWRARRAQRSLELSTLITGRRGTHKGMLVIDD